MIIKKKKNSLSKIFNIVSDLFTGKDVIISRTACLSNSMLEKLDTSNFVRYNHQVSRTDYILKIENDESSIIDLDEILKFVPSKDIHEVFCQQKNTFFRYKNVSMIFIDSFCDLTTQLFVSKKGSCFCSLYRWLNHCEEFNSLYESTDLLNLDNLQKIYDELFSKLIKTYGNIPLIFIHFPTKFDSREKFKTRGKKILEAINTLTCKYDNLISIEPDFVEKDLEDDFPYHFSEATFTALANKISSLNILKLKFQRPEYKALINRRITKILISLVPLKKLRQKLRGKYQL